MGKFCILSEKLWPSWIVVKPGMVEMEAETEIERTLILIGLMLTSIALNGTDFHSIPLLSRFNVSSSCLNAKKDLLLNKVPWKHLCKPYAQ